MGATSWKRLHRLAYVAAIAGVLHYYMLVIANIRQPVAFATVLSFLLGDRVVVQIIKRANGGLGNKRPSAVPITKSKNPQIISKSS